MPADREPELPRLGPEDAKRENGRLRLVGPCDLTMTTPLSPSPSLRELPSVDEVLGWPEVKGLVAEFGRPLVTDAIRERLQATREAWAGADASECALPAPAVMAERLGADVRALLSPSLKAVFNLTGTVLHTNLGRAPLPEAAVAAMREVAVGASNLEYDLGPGRRGERNQHVESWLCRLTGAESSLVVNNNAAAVLLVLNTLALRKKVPVSRGELIEIGGSFRLPDIMARAGCKLVEVGTTNRTHLADYERAIDSRTAILMKVHTSNYWVEGFTASVGETELAGLARERALPLVVDLGSGTLIDLARYGLPPEPTVGSMLTRGVDLVTYSGDKLLGGPQAGIISGRASLVARIRRNPLLRALRPDKVTLAALGAVLRLYADPERLPDRLPALRLMARAPGEIEALARRLAPAVAGRLGESATVEVVPCHSQVGSGALPVGRLPSFALRVNPVSTKRGRGRRLKQLAAAFRALEVPVIGRIHEDALLLDLRCLEDETIFVRQLGQLMP